MTSNQNLISFRLPADFHRTLLRLAKDAGQQPGLYAKDIVTTYLIKFEPMDEINHRLSSVDKLLQYLVEQNRNESDAIRESTGELAGAVNEVRAAVATAAVELLVRFGAMESSEAIQWAKSVFQVKE